MDSALKTLYARVQKNGKRMTDGRVYSSAGYYVCSHVGCSKKVNESIPDHECCGRCFQGRNCLTKAQNSYDGPGVFFHSYAEALLRPGVCAVCGLSRDAH